MSWWVPVGVAGAIALGALLAFALSAMTGSRRPAGPTEEQAAAGIHTRAGDAPGRGTRYDEDNAVLWNPFAFLVVAGLLGGLVGLALLIELL